MPDVGHESTDLSSPCGAGQGRNDTAEAARIGRGSIPDISYKWGDYQSLKAAG